MVYANHFDLNLALMAEELRRLITELVDAVGGELQ